MYLFSEIRSSLISKFQDSDLNEFHKTLDNYRSQYISSLSQDTIHFSFVYIDYLCASPSQTNNKQTLDWLKYHYTQNPNNFTLLYMYYLLVDSNKEIPSFMCRFKLRKILFDCLHKTFSMKKEINISPFYAIGLAHIWPFLHARALCNEGILPAIQKYNIWSDPSWSMNQPLENILGSITYITPNDQ